MSQQYFFASKLCEVPYRSVCHYHSWQIDLLKCSYAIEGAGNRSVICQQGTDSAPQGLQRSVVRFSTWCNSYSRRFFILFSGSLGADVRLLLGWPGLLGGDLGGCVACEELVVDQCILTCDTAICPLGEKPALSPSCFL